MKNKMSGAGGEKRLSSQQKLILAVVGVFLIPTFFVAKNLFMVIAQDRDKRQKIVKKISFDNEPIEFIALEADGVSIKPNERFTRDEEWLRDFTIRFKNTSGKPIVYLSIVLGFPETGPNGRPLARFLKYGAHPSARANINSTPVKLAPNDIAEVKFSVEDFENLERFVRSRRLLSELTEVNFRIMVVYFEDGTHWSAGSMFRPDPNSPGKSIPIDGNREVKK